jgi:exopolysaccharide biosynthesis protein
MTINIYVNKRKSIAFIMFIVVFFSILSFEHIYYSNKNIISNNYDNILNSYYLSEEILNFNLNEEKLRDEMLNFRSQKNYRNFITNFFDRNNEVSFYNKITNKNINTAVLNRLFIIYDISVFIVLFIHKKDGKV